MRVTDDIGIRVGIIIGSHIRTFREQSAFALSALHDLA